MGSYQFIIAVTIALVIQYFVACTYAQDNDWESPIAKRKRLSIQRLRELGRLRRLIKRGGYATDDAELNDDMKRSGVFISDYPPFQVLQELEDLENAGLSPEDLFQFESEDYKRQDKAQRSPARDRGGWYTGLMGKRPAKRMVREAKQHQAFMSDDYFGKRVTREGEHAADVWQGGYNVDGNADIEAINTV